MPSFLLAPRRYLATSAQKRKWLREQGKGKPFIKKKYAGALLENDAVAAKGETTSTNWRPLFFLGVWPVVMSIAVVLNRDDLRDEVNDKGIGRFVEDYKRWRTTPSSDDARLSPGQKLHVDEDESEYDQLLNQLREKKE